MDGWSLWEVLVMQVVTLAAVAGGFWMGFKAKIPDKKLIERKFDPGSTDEPEGDVWAEALTKPAEDEEERGIPTL